MTTTTMLQTVLLIASCIKMIATSGPEPTVIFLGANGRPLTSSGNEGLYSSSNTNGFGSLGSSAASIISSFKSREPSRESGGSLYSLIRDRLGERLQERSSKKGPRIIVIPQMASKSQQQAPQQQQQQQQPSSGYSNSNSYSPSYPSSYMAYNSPYSSASAAAASSSYPSYAPFSYASQMSAYQTPYPYSSYGMSPAYASPYASSYQYNAGPSSSSLQPSAAASTPFASYAYAPANFLSNLLSSGSSAASSLVSKSTYSSLLPYLAQALSQTLYPF